MSQCFNPDCLSNKSFLTDNYCQYCRQKLLLTERYRGLRYLGEGGFGRTFVGIDTNRHNTHCVIKQFLPLQQGSSALQKCIELFKQESQLLEKLGKYPQIPDLLAFFEQEGKLYLVQEFIEGENLLAELQRKKRFTQDEVKTFLVEMLPVLDFIHKKDVIHRDIKPENIIRRKTSLDSEIYGRKISDLVLIDFGVSKQITSSVMTKLGTGVGTPGYSAPEQSRGMVNYSSDLYSLAVTAIRLFTGIVPREVNYSVIDEIFDLNTMSWVWKQLLQQQGISVDQQLANVLDRMLQDLPINRYKNAQEVLNDLTQSYTKTVVVTSQPPPVNPIYQKMSKRGLPLNFTTKKISTEINGR
jgi:serine/threonine protein kinase